MNYPATESVALPKHYRQVRNDPRMLDGDRECEAEGSKQIGCVIELRKGLLWMLTASEDWKAASGGPLDGSRTALSTGVEDRGMSVREVVEHGISYSLLE